MKKNGSMFMFVVFFWFLTIDVLLISTDDSVKLELSINMGREVKIDE